jgi:hypothetical protein
MSTPRLSRADVLTRFERKCERIPMAGCWIWLGTVSNMGHGRFMNGDGEVVGAHRVSYELFVGPIPDGAFICHKCDVPSCVNPSHLFAGTQADNMRDCAAKGRRARGRKHHWAVLTDEQVRAIRLDRRMGKEIGPEYGVTAACVWAIKRGDRWGWMK